MTYFGMSRRRVMLPLLDNWPTPVSIRGSVRQALRRGVSGLMTSAMLVAIAALVVITLGLRPPQLHQPSRTKPATAANASTVKPKNLNGTSTTKCTVSQTQDNPLFNACPSFAADYSDQQTGTIDPNSFNVYSGVPVANHEAQYYTGNPDNLRIDHGSLVLQAQQQSYGSYNFTSARINTQGKEDFLYGKIVVRAKLPKGIGTWPSIWMLPSQPRYAQLSPASDHERYLNDGELDIAEAIGTQPNKIYGIAHSVAYPEDGINRAYFNTIILPDSATAFHDYELDWTPTALTFRVDGTAYFTYRKHADTDWRSWPFDQPFYLVINLALGGSWGGTDTKDFPGDGVDPSALPASLNVQSIKYYPYAQK